MGGEHPCVGQAIVPDLDHHRHATLHGLHDCLGDQLALGRGQQRTLTRAAADVKSGGALGEYMLNHARNLPDVDRTILAKRGEGGGNEAAQKGRGRHPGMLGPLRLARK